jgi:hypothetical protein
MLWEKVIASERCCGLMLCAMIGTVRDAVREGDCSILCWSI